MSANFGYPQRGPGVYWSRPEGGTGGSSLSSDAKVSLTNEDLTRLKASSAKEAIDSLTGIDQADKLPDVDSPSFPGPVAEAFYWCNDALVGIQGPVGSGKTTTVMKSRLRRAVEMPRSVVDGIRYYTVLFVRETYRQLWSTTIPSYLETYPKEMGKWSGGRGDPVTHEIQFEDEYGPVVFVSMFMAFGDDITAAMRGLQVTDIVLNEADTMPVDVMTTGIGRIDRFPKKEHFAGLPEHLQSYGQIVCDFNAPDEENWTFLVFHDEQKRKELFDALNVGEDDGPVIQIRFFEQPGYGEEGCENLHNLSKQYYPRQIMSYKAAGRSDQLRRMVYNKVGYLRVGDPVFLSDFQRSIHVSTTKLAPWPGVPLRIGLDQGFKAGAVIGQCGPDFRWRILGELHFPDERLLGSVFGARLAEFVERNWPGFEIEAGWADMAGEHGASQAADENATWNREVRRVTSWTIRPQRIGTNRIQPRLEAVRAALSASLVRGEPGLLIDPSCTFLIRGFEARYVWTTEVDKNGDKRKVPNKDLTEANVHDALQYLLLSEHKGDGSSPYVHMKSPDHRKAQLGHNGGPPLDGGAKGGLQRGWDIMRPYGGLQ